MTVGMELQRIAPTKTIKFVRGSFSYHPYTGRGVLVAVDYPEPGLHKIALDVVNFEYTDGRVDADNIEFVPENIYVSEKTLSDMQYTNIYKPRFEGSVTCCSLID